MGYLIAHGPDNGVPYFKSSRTRKSIDSASILYYDTILSENISMYVHKHCRSPHNAHLIYAQVLKHKVIALKVCHVKIAQVCLGTAGTTLYFLSFSNLICLAEFYNSVWKCVWYAEKDFLPRVTIIVFIMLLESWNMVIIFIITFLSNIKFLIMRVSLMS